MNGMKLQGFELGVDEYISKPFSPKILVARVEAILRRTSGPSADEVIWRRAVSEVDKAAHDGDGGRQASGAELSRNLSC